MKPTVTNEMKRLNYLTSEIDAAYHEAALKFGLTDSTMQVLYAAGSNGGNCLIRDICRLSGISRQTVNSALRKLEADGAIYLEADSGRRKKVFLTQKGQETAKNSVHRLFQIENDIFASWPEADQEKYLELTQRFLLSFKDKVKRL